MNIVWAQWYLWLSKYNAKCGENRNLGQNIGIKVNLISHSEFYIGFLTPPFLIDTCHSGIILMNISEGSTLSTKPLTSKNQHIINSEQDLVNCTT